jgi:hypothetical protein
MIMGAVIRTVLQFLAVLLVLCGLPVFLILGAALGAFATLDAPADAVDKFFRFYTCFAFGGLLTASGAILWCVAKRIYYVLEREQSAKSTH